MRICESDLLSSSMLGKSAVLPGVGRGVCKVWVITLGKGS